MPDYQYRAVDSSGRGVSGVMNAPDADSLESKLMEAGCWLLEAAEREDRTKKALFERKSKIKRRDLIDFFIQVGSLVSSGVTLLDSLKTLAQDTSKPAFRAVLEDIARNVEAGNSLYESMSVHPGVFSGQIVSMVQAAEQSGAMPETFREITRYLEWLDRLMGDIKQATIYPIMVFMALILFVTILFTFVVPKFTAILTSLKIALPLPTRIVMAVSAAMIKTWWMWLAVIIFSPVVKRTAYKRSEKFAMAYDRMKLRLPVFGEMNRMFTLSRFAQNFASLFNAGIPVLQSLQLCEGLVGNKVMEQAIKDARRDVAEGIMMSDSMRESEILTPMTLRMISVGETTGDLGAALQNVSNYYNEEIPRRVKKVFGVVEPALIITLVVIVGLTALAIFMPILSLLGGIKG